MVTRPFTFFVQVITACIPLILHKYITMTTFPGDIISCDTVLKYSDSGSVINLSLSCRSEVWSDAVTILNWDTVQRSKVAQKSKLIMASLQGLVVLLAMVATIHGCKLLVFADSTILRAFLILSRYLVSLSLQSIVVWGRNVAWVNVWNV